MAQTDSSVSDQKTVKKNLGELILKIDTTDVFIFQAAI